VRGLCLLFKVHAMAGSLSELSSGPHKDPAWLPQLTTDMQEMQMSMAMLRRRLLRESFIDLASTSRRRQEAAPRSPLSPIAGIPEEAVNEDPEQPPRTAGPKFGQAEKAKLETSLRDLLEGLGELARSSPRLPATMSGGGAGSTDKAAAAPGGHHSASEVVTPPKQPKQEPAENEGKPRSKPTRPSATRTAASSARSDPNATPTPGARQRSSHHASSASTPGRTATTHKASPRVRRDLRRAHLSQFTPNTSWSSFGLRFQLQVDPATKPLPPH